MWRQLTGESDDDVKSECWECCVREKIDEVGKKEEKFSRRTRNRSECPSSLLRKRINFYQFIKQPKRNVRANHIFFIVNLHHSILFVQAPIISEHCREGCKVELKMLPVLHRLIIGCNVQRLEHIGCLIGRLKLIINSSPLCWSLKWWNNRRFVVVTWFQLFSVISSEQSPFVVLKVFWPKKS